MFYPVETQERIITNILNHGYNLAEGSLQDRVWRSADAIEFLIPTLKNQAFHQEEESRLIFSPTAACSINPRFRVGRGMLIPYYSLRELANGFPENVGRLPITAVTVGPSVQRQLNVEGARMLLAQHGYANVEVRASSTPFRG